MTLRPKSGKVIVVKDCFPTIFSDIEFDVAVLNFLSVSVYFVQEVLV
jgi:hypothetical protein